jgi:hypothetical protein
VLGCRLDDQRFESWQRLGIFLFTMKSRLALEPTQLPIQWVPGALFLAVKRPESEADHLPPSTAKVKNSWSYSLLPNMPSWHGAQLKHRDKFTFTFMSPVIEQDE